MLPMKSTLETLVAQMDDGGININTATREFKRRFVIRVLDRHRGNQSKAARDLGWHRNTMARNLQILEINPAEHRGSKPVQSEQPLTPQYSNYRGA